MGGKTLVPVFVSMCALLTRAEACSFASPIPLLPAVGVDPPTEPIRPPAKVEFSVTRGDATYVTSCSDLGIIRIRITPSEWAELPRFARPLDIGYQFELVATDIDEAEYTGFDTEPVSPPDAGDGYYIYTFAWIDKISPEQEPIRVTLRVYAVDRWDRRSVPIVINIRDPGRRR